MTSLKECTAEIKAIAESGIWTLDAQLRAYGTLEELLSGYDADKEDVEEFLRIYDICSGRLAELFDSSALLAMAEERLHPYEKALEEASAKAEEAARLHEAAKETFRIWQTSGFFARRRALKELRRLAGFRLESDRIGNYSAKTYDLAEEARRAYQKAQQAFYSANISYKCRHNLYLQIFQFLKNSF